MSLFNRTVVVIPLFFTLALFIWASSPQLRQRITQPLADQLASPSPFLQFLPSPSPVGLPNPCELIMADELTSITAGQFLPPKLAPNQYSGDLLLQKCLWLATDEKLTPTITLTLTSSVSTDSAVLTDAWQLALQQSSANKRFKVVPERASTDQFVSATYSDSWGTHVRTTNFILTIQASMPKPVENQATELRLLESVMPRLSVFDSSDQSAQ